VLPRPPFEVNSCVEKFKEQKPNGKLSAQFLARTISLLRESSVVSEEFGNFKVEAFFSYSYFLEREREREREGRGEGETIARLKIKLTQFFFPEKL